MPHQGKISVTFDDQGKASVNMSGRLPQGTQEHVQELMGWVSRQPKPKADKPNSPMGRPEVDPSSLNGGEMGSRDQVLNQDAAGASHIMPAEQAEEAPESDIKEITGGMHGAPPVQRQSPRPITAGAHALSTTKDDGKHVHTELGTTNPATEEMMMVDAGEMEPQLEEDQEKDFEKRLSEMRLRMDSAIKMHDHESLRAIHDEFNSLREEYKHAIDQAHKQNAITSEVAHGQDGPTSADSVPPSPMEQAQEMFEEPPNAQEPHIPPEPEDDTGGTGEIAAKREPSSEDQATMGESIDADLQAHTDIANEIPGFMSEVPELLETDDEEEDANFKRGFWPMFAGIDWLSKANIKGTTGGINFQNAEHKAVPRAGMTAVKRKSRGNHKYIKRWFEGGHWRYQYTNKTSERHGYGKDAVQAMGNMHESTVSRKVDGKKKDVAIHGEHTIEVHPNLLKRGREPKNFVKDAANAYDLTIRGLHQGTNHRIGGIEKDPAQLAWTETDTHGNHHVVRQHFNKEYEVHRAATEEPHSQPHEFDFKDSHTGTIAGYRSHLATSQAKQVWDDRSGEPWLALHSYPSKVTKKIKNEAGDVIDTITKNRKIFELSEVAGNEKGIAGKTDFNKMKFVDMGSVRRVAAFIQAFHNGESSNSKVRAFGEFGKKETQHKDGSVLDRLEKGEVYYTAHKRPATVGGEQGEAYVLNPSIPQKQLDEILDNPQFQKIYSNAVWRSKIGFLIATTEEKGGKGIRMSDSTIEEMKSRSMQESVVLNLLSVRHTPGRTRFMTGYIPGNNVFGYLANSLAHRARFQGALVNEAMRVQSSTKTEEAVSGGGIPGMSAASSNRPDRIAEKKQETGAKVGVERLKGESVDDYTARWLAAAEGPGVNPNGDVYVSEEHEDIAGAFEGHFGEEMSAAQRDTLEDAMEVLDRFDGDLEEAAKYFEGLNTGKKFRGGGDIGAGSAPGGQDEDETVANLNAMMEMFKKKKVKKSTEGATTEALHDARRQYGSVAGYTDDAEDVPLGTGEDAGVPGQETIRDRLRVRKGLEMTDTTEEHLMSLVKSLHQARKDGHITDEVLKGNAAYTESLDLLETRKRSRLMKSAAMEVSHHPLAYNVLSGLIDASFGLDVSKSVGDVLKSQNGRVQAYYDCDETEAAQHVLGWYGEMKSHPMFKSAVYLSMAADWDGTSEGEMFLGFAKEAMTNHFISNGGGRPNPSGS